MKKKNIYPAIFNKQAWPVEYLFFSINQQAKAPEITLFCLHVINLLFNMLQAISNLRHIFALYSSHFYKYESENAYVLSSRTSRTDKISAGWQQFNNIIYKMDLCLVVLINKM